MTPRPAVPPRRRFLAQWLGLGLLLLLLGGNMLTSLQASYQAIETSERERLEKQGAVVSKNLAPLIFSANRAIEGILEDLPRWKSVQDGNQLANRRLEVISDTLPGIRSLLITNASGRVVSSNKPETIGLDLSQRDHFRAARQDPNPRTLFVTQPFRSLINTYVMVLVRVIPGPNGEFNGIVIASIDPEYFRTLLDSVLYAQDMFAYVAHGDGKLFLVSPEAKNAAGKDLAEAGSVFQRHVDSRAPASLLLGDSRIANGEHMIALRTVQPHDLFMNKPLVLAVARETGAIFADWREDARHEGWIFAAVLLVSCLGLFSVQRRRLTLDRIDADRDAEQARFTAALAASETRYRSLVESTQDLIARVDAQGRFTFVNNAAESVFGLAPQECIGLSAFEFVHPDDRDATQTAFALWLEAKTSRLGFENRQVSRGGGVRLMQWDISADQNAAGEVLGFSGVARDVTQMRQAELEIRQGRNDLAKSVALLELTGRIARVGGWSLDPATRALEWTQQTYQIHELEPSEPVDVERAINFYAPEARPVISAAVEECIETGRAFDVELPLVTALGNRIWVHAQGQAEQVDGKTVRLTGACQNVTERKAAADEIEHLAFFDPLTDLPNRRLLLDRLQHALTSSTRHQRHGALMLLDMDDFKTLNDTLGHDVGDQFLVEVARRIQACVREGDTVARQGGDEFVVILEDLDMDSVAAMQAENVAVKILHAIDAPYLLDLTAQDGIPNTRRYHCTSSIGITLFRDTSVSVDELMKRADTAMYQAKAAGRNLLRFFDLEMQEVVTARAALDNDLGEAVQEEQFVLFFQPQVDAAGNRIGAEALLRWRHPKRGLVSPGEFIPQAELTGQIIPIGRWVLETACAQLVAWAAQPGTAHLSMAVNVSARQFRSADFVEQVLAILAKSGANPNRLKLELTESLLLDDVEDVISKMTALKARGVGFSLDDFGTGYSSLSYLKRLPLDQLKIDQSFVRDVLNNPNDATIARTIVALANSMGLAVIAEGVETEAQREFLAANGCAAYQGYLFGRPVPIEEF